MSALAPTMQAFFTDRLIRERRASPHTVASYRDTMRLLLAFAQQRLGKQPSWLELEEIDAELVRAFLEHLERDRGNTARTRNNRLAAIHSLFAFAALRHPEQAAHIQRVLAIPPKRFERALITWLTDTEVDALLAAPDRSRWAGRRDHALLVVATHTGLRASELIGLSCGDAHLETGAHISCLGKGRKERITPLTRNAATVLRGWLAERRAQAIEPLFPARHGGRLTRDGLERRLARHIVVAAKRSPTLGKKHVTMHTLRHTTAMRLLHAGVDTTVIALWLGHESVETTQIYLHADLALKERALARTSPPGSSPTRYRPGDNLLAFLEGL
jgi:site-specific recombinase XerD